MKKFITLVLLLITTAYVSAETTGKEKIRAMILGSFHFNYPSRDKHVTKENNRVDMMSEKRQKEITEVIECLKRFKPTKIMIETNITFQKKTDKRYASYVEGNYKLRRDEREQLGFRIAKELGHKRVYCVNTMSGDIDRYLKDKDDFFKELEIYDEKGPFSKTEQEYFQFYESNEKYLRKASLRDFYLRTNTKEHIDRMQGAYFLNVFHWEQKKLDYAGTDWQCARWNNRNMRIFRNISRYSEAGDRILIIYGSGHHAHLRDYINYSPFHEYVSPVEYLKR